MKEEENETPGQEASGKVLFTHSELKRLIARIDEEYREFIRTHEFEERPLDMRRNLAGTLENAKYPPNLDAYGSYCGGYPTNAQECFFYYFAVMGYVLRANSAAKMQPYPWCSATTAARGT